MTSGQFRYKGTKQFVKVGDNVKLSNHYANQYGYNGGIVVGLQSFITVQLPNGDKIDFDSRSVSFLSNDTNVREVTTIENPE